MKYFLLDKKFALENQSRCIGISDRPFTQEEIKNAKLIYNTQETIVYISTDDYDDIPHHIEYDPINNTIVEKKTNEIKEMSAYSDVISQEEKIFDEDIEIQQDINYFYIDKNIADKEFIAVNIATFKKPLLNPNEYFQREVYEIKGSEYPNYITVEDGIVREATEYEKYQRGQRKLKDREVVFKEEIIYLEEGWYIDGEELIKVPKPNGVKLIFNEETHKWVETATLEEIKDYIGKYIGDELLIQVLAKGCEVEIAGEKHTQILDDRKLIILSSTGTGVLISQYARQGVDSIPWSFNDDGSDSTILTLEQFSQLALQCLDYAIKCYTVADILKAQNRLDVTLEEFLDELEKLNTPQVAMMSMSAKTPSPLYTVQQTINKYNKLNNVLDCEDMKDVGVFTDYRAYMKELFEYESKLNKGITVLSDIPVPSERLQAYFNELEEQGRI